MAKELGLSFAELDEELKTFVINTDSASFSEFTAAISNTPHPLPLDFYKMTGFALLSDNQEFVAKSLRMLSGMLPYMLIENKDGNYVGFPEMSEEEKTDVIDTMINCSLNGLQLQNPEAVCKACDLLGTVGDAVLGGVVNFEDLNMKDHVIEKAFQILSETEMESKSPLVKMNALHRLAMIAGHGNLREDLKVKYKAEVEEKALRFSDDVGHSWETVSLVMMVLSDKRGLREFGTSAAFSPEILAEVLRRAKKQTYYKSLAEYVILSWKTLSLQIKHEDFENLNDRFLKALMGVPKGLCNSK